MANLRDLKLRIKSVNNIKKITDTMEKVATARSKKATKSYHASLPYFKEIRSILRQVLQNDYNTPGNADVKKYVKNDNELKRVAILVVTSDRGLCGGFNTNVIRKAVKISREYKKQNIEPLFYLVGKKAINYFKFSGIPIEKSYTGISEEMVNFEDTFINEDFLPKYIKGEVDKLEIVYQHYYSATTQKADNRTVLPLSSWEGLKAKGKDDSMTEYMQDLGEDRFFELLPEADLGAAYLFPEVVKTLLFHYRMQTHLSEHIARRIAMKQATDSAGDMIEMLRKEYNRTRQSKITTEIIEIVTASRAINK